MDHPQYFIIIYVKLPQKWVICPALCNLAVLLHTSPHPICIATKIFHRKGSGDWVDVVISFHWLLVPLWTAQTSARQDSITSVGLLDFMGCKLLVSWCLTHLRETLLICVIQRLSKWVYLCWLCQWSLKTMWCESTHCHNYCHNVIIITKWINVLISNDLRLENDHLWCEQTPCGNITAVCEANLLFIFPSLPHLLTLACFLLCKHYWNFFKLIGPDCKKKKDV